VRASALSGSSPDQSPKSAGGRVVLAIDAYEELRLLDTWLRQVFVPSLSARTRILMVSREQPVGRWMSAPEWGGLFQSAVVQTLPPPDALDLLAQAGTPLESARRINAVASSLSQEVGLALGAQAGEARIREVARGAGFSSFRRAAQTPFNLIFEVRS
jgi:hypothetical protein